MMMMMMSLTFVSMSRRRSMICLVNTVAALQAVALFVMVLMSPKAVESTSSRAYFVFGDSLVDSGNNNFLATTARADFPPYGVDYPTHLPTGRFSNGFNFPDLIGEAMGLPPILPYLHPGLQGQQLLNGANFASAGIGILNDTGYQFANIIRMFKQFQLFEEYQHRVGAMIGPAKAQELVNNALVLITLGGNDFVNNYFLRPYSFRRQQFALPDYCRFIVTEYRNILTRLYELGARRVLVTGTGPLGCIPGELALYGSKNGECIPDPQRAAEIFNPELFQMIDGLNKDIGSDVFISTNAFDLNMDFITDPQKFGFATSKVACCGQGPYNGLGICNGLSNLCQNRDLHVFWDAFHPTERALRIIVNQLKTGSTKYMNPMNLSTIMAIDSSKTSS